MIDEGKKPMTPIDLLTCNDVLQLTGIKSRTTIWRRVKNGKFPPPVDIGSSRIRWRLSDVQEWIAALPNRTY